MREDYSGYTVKLDTSVLKFTSEVRSNCPSGFNRRGKKSTSYMYQQQKKKERKSKCKGMFLVFCLLILVVDQQQLDPVTIYSTIYLKVQLPDFSYL